MVNDSVGRGDFLKFQTASTTIEIPTGRIVGLDSNGNVTLADATANPIGVSATKVASRTSASKEDIVVQVSGLAHVTCAANEAFSYNDFVAGGTEGYATTFASIAGTTFSSEKMKKIIGRVVTPDATTEGTTVIIRVGIC